VWTATRAGCDIGLFADAARYATKAAWPADSPSSTTAPHLPPNSREPSADTTNDDICAPKKIRDHAGLEVAEKSPGWKILHLKPPPHICIPAQPQCVWNELGSLVSLKFARAAVDAFV
jgi:hypothetical protein